jgi:hypothetical protein
MNPDWKDVVCSLYITEFNHMDVRVPCSWHYCITYYVIYNSLPWQLPKYPKRLLLSTPRRSDP